MKITKKIYGIAAASVLICIYAGYNCLNTTASGQNPSLTVGNTAVQSGESFYVNIDISDVPTEGINMAEFGIEYDSSALTVTAVNPGEIYREDEDLGIPALAITAEDGFISIVYGNGSSDEDTYITNSGTFMTIEGTVNGDAVAGQYDLKLTANKRNTTETEVVLGILRADNSYTMYTPTITDGYVVVSESPADFIPGDANSDGKTDVRDCAAIARALAKGTTAELPISADYNADGEITVRDAAAIAKSLAEK